MVTAHQKSWKGEGGLNPFCFILIVALVGLWSCGKDKVDPLPDYLQLPSSLANYSGSGLINVEGGLSLRAEGSEALNATTKTYSGVMGNISNNYLLTTFTAGQPLPYKESSSVPGAYLSNGELRIINTYAVGTYRMGVRETPSPRGEIADMTLNLPGPQVYITQTGSLTIEESTIVKTEGTHSLYRVKGSFQAVLNGSGVGTVPGRDIPVTGTFDLLLRSN